MRYIFLIILTLNVLVAQKANDYVDDKALRYTDYIYKKDIRTVMLYNTSWELSAPIIKLNGSDQLLLSFDDLSNLPKQYSYTVVHCDASWNPTDLMQMDYLSGYMDEQITKYDFAIATAQKYIHYQIAFPTNGLKITKSGNYLLKVFEDFDQEKLVLTKRMMVVDEKIIINGIAHQSTITEGALNNQEVDFTVNYGNYYLQNPSSNTKVCILQNHRWDNALMNLKPQFIGDNLLDFNYDRENSFNGGNEYRNFDLKDLRYPTMRVESKYTDSLGYYHANLINEDNLGNKRYYTYSDINGRYLIRNNNSVNVDIQSDYVYVKFFLPYKEQDVNSNFYIYGQLTYNQCKNENKMIYNNTRKGYECTLFVKQGYYDYKIMQLKDGNKVPDEAAIEGNHWETENEYTVLVYHTAQGTYYDQLIGLKNFNSVKR